MAQLELIEAIERRLWTAADTLRANSSYASNEYFLPVMGLIFLRHAYSRFLTVKDDIEANLPKRGGKTRPLTKEDFSQKSSIFLQPSAQFDTLVALPDSENRAKAIIEAMESIEADYESLRGILPKNEYQELDDDVLGQLLRTLNPSELKQVEGDVFGRIYEYFLTQFADQKAHDGGEFFTPISLVSLIAHILDPQGGIVLDPACGSGGMFVQSARIVEQKQQNPNEKLTFKGLEKNAITIRLAKMNLAVHGLEGDIQQAITYYEDPHALLGKAQYVMANPPFNVNEIDAEKVKTDPRLPFGLPGINQSKKVPNGNYIWISYFYSYLNDTGRAGFVMSSQASSAGGKEAQLRQALVETGHVDIMVAIRANFFYTRTVPCELWFFHKAKSKAQQDMVLMIDARNIYRKVTRKIYDFSPEHEQNLLAIVALHRGQTRQYIDIVTGYCHSMMDAAVGSAIRISEQQKVCIPAFLASLNAVSRVIQPFLETLSPDVAHAEALENFQSAQNAFERAFLNFVHMTVTQEDKEHLADNAQLLLAVKGLHPIAEGSRHMVAELEQVYKLLCRLLDVCEKDCGARKSAAWVSREVTRARKELEAVRQNTVEKLKSIAYFHKNALWLTERFPDAKLRDVEGLVKCVTREEIAANDWSLTPGRYVGVAPEETDADFDFAESLREIHTELDALNDEAVELAARIKRNFEGLGV